MYVHRNVTGQQQHQSEMRAMKVFATREVTKQSTKRDSNGSRNMNTKKKTNIQIPPTRRLYTKRREKRTWYANTSCSFTEYTTKKASNTFRVVAVVVLGDVYKIVINSEAVALFNNKIGLIALFRYINMYFSFWISIKIAD